jgi:hypothetical protein
MTTPMKLSSSADTGCGAQYSITPRSKVLLEELIVENTTTISMEKTF